MMESDAIVVGGELEGLVAALRLLERGASVRLLAPGAGSLSYLPGGVALLGYGAAGPCATIDDPWAALGDLLPQHPLRLLGRNRVEDALHWFEATMVRLGADWSFARHNRTIVGMAGGLRSVLGAPRSQATLDNLAGRRVAVVAFERFRDFPGNLVVAGLRARDVDAVLIEVRAPVSVPDSARVGQALDRADLAATLLASVRVDLPRDVDLVLFPAVLGLLNHRRVLEQATNIIGLPVFEASTMPPSLPGLRLQQTLLGEIERRGGIVQPGMRGLRAEIRNGRCLRLRDSDGREYRAGLYVAATGGVLMSGLEIDSRGHVFEPVFGLPVRQTEPLRQRTPAETIDAMHQAGVEADVELRPTAGDGRLVENLRIVGATLAHWNSSREDSLEGVAIATGWTAAEGVARMCGH